MRPLVRAGPDHHFRHEHIPDRSQGPKTVAGMPNHSAGARASSSHTAARPRQAGTRSRARPHAVGKRIGSQPIGPPDRYDTTAAPSGSIRPIRYAWPWRVRHVSSRRGCSGRVWTSASSAAVQLPVGGSRGRPRWLDELLPERFPVTAVGVLDDRGRHREHRALPGCVEDQLPVAAGPVQIRQAQRGAHRRATPIIESRVTSPANSASVMPSVAGRRSDRTS
jgi:hypothetical protein